MTMHKETSYWIKFSTQDVVNCSLDFDPSLVKWPDEASYFTKHKRIDVIDDNNTYRGVPQPLGGKYFHPDCKVETQEEVKANPTATGALIDNLTCNNWSHIAWSRQGDWPQPFNPRTDTSLIRPTE